MKMMIHFCFGFSALFFTFSMQLVKIFNHEKDF